MFIILSIRIFCKIIRNLICYWRFRDLNFEKGKNLLTVFGILYKCYFIILGESYLLRIVKYCQVNNVTIESFFNNLMIILNYKSEVFSYVLCSHDSRIFRTFSLIFRNNNSRNTTQYKLYFILVNGTRRSVWYNCK